MALTFTGAGSTQNATGQGSTVVTTSTSFAVGDYLVVLMAYDNSGGGGADPMSGNLTLTPASGALGASVSQQTGLNDPGSASAGLAVRCDCRPVTTTIPTSTNFTVAWTGTANAKAIVFMKVSTSLGAGASIAYRTNNGATGVIASNVGVANAAALVTGTVNSGEGVLCWAAEENGIALTGDADTADGSWGSIYGTFNATTGGVGGMAAYMQAKVVTGTNTQTFNPTGNATASDWITGWLIFTETVFPAVSQTAYRFYDDGTESGSTALGTQSTAYSPDVTADVNLGLRVRLQLSSAAATAATDDWQLQFDKNASGTWANVGDTVVTIYDETNRNVGSVIGGATSSKISMAQSFTGDGKKLSRAGFNLQRNSSPDGNLTAVLYAHTGTLGTDSAPTGTALATSTARASSTVGAGSFAWVYFEFDGTYTLANGTNYCIAILTDQTLNDAANISVGADSSSPTAAGNSASQATSGGAWTAGATSDLIFSVHTSDPASAVIEYDSPSLTDAAATTNRLGAGSGSFVAGKVSEDGLVDNLGWSASNYTEVLYSLTLVAADLANADALTFRVLKNSAVTHMTYTSTPTLNVTKVAGPALTQAAYQFFDETGTESGATSLAAQNTAVSGNLTNGDGYGLVRIRLQSTSSTAVPATDDFTLQWEKNANGTWTSVPAGAVVGYDAPSLTEAQATTNRLTGGTGSFEAGKVAEDGVVDNVGWTGNNFTELVWSVRLVAAQLASGDTLRFRVVKNGSTTDMTYTQTPTVNIVSYRLTPVVMAPRVPS